jgi:hypothetical protein
MNIRIRSVGLDSISNKYKKAANDIGNDSLLKEIGVAAKAIIVQRTRDGKDTDGKSFVPYADTYLKYRQRKGRTVDVNLTWSGRMLSSITYKLISTTQILLTFVRGEEAVKAYFNDKKRPFFSLNDRELKDINNKIIKLHLRALGK